MRRRRRSAFTLLEVLLASMIAVLLMSALYVAVDIQIRQARHGREVIEQSTLARALLTRMAADITPSLAPTLPDTGSSSTSSTTTQTGGTAATGTGTGTGATDPMATQQATSATTTTTTGTTGTAFPVNLGVQGDNTQLTLTISRVPHEVFQPDENGQIPLTSDLRKVMWWLSSTGTGLARYEFRVATADETQTSPLDLGDEASHVIAEEVRSLQIQYFDGTTWLDSWDGSTPVDGGTAPKGPPLLISIRVGLGPPGVPNPTDNQIKYYRHVVALPTANGLPSSTTTTQTATTTTP